MVETCKRGKPWEKQHLLIGFYTEGLPFNGETMMKQSLGGAETALTCMARELTKLGHDVKVFCNCEEPGQFDDVDYYHVSDFPKLAPVFEYDVLIVSRFSHVLCSKFKSKMNILWAHDVLADKDKFVGQVWQADEVWVLSEFHKRNYAERFENEVEKEAMLRLMWVTQNGIDLSMIDGDSAADKPSGGKRNGKRLIYTSRPERGLLVLLRDIWPRLRQFDPDLELAICWYDYKGMPLPEPIVALHAECERLAEQPGVVKLGSLTKSELYAEMKKSSLWLYPTAFPEISCLGAMEAMACGAVPVTTQGFALKETIGEGCGVLIAGHNESEEYQDAFVANACELLMDEVKAAKMRRAGRKWVEGRYQWSQVAEAWDERIHELFYERMTKKKRGVVESLFRYADVVAARAFAGAHDLPEAVKRADKILATAETPEEEPGDLVGLDPEKHTWGLTSRFQKVLQMVHELKPKHFLDLGSHCGTMPVAVSNALPGCKAVGVDFTKAYHDWSFKHLEKAGMRKENVEFVHSSLNDFARRHRKKYDVVFAGEILEHLVNTTVALSQIQRLCKKGGTVILTLPSGPWAHFDLSEYVHNDGGHMHYFDFQDIKDLFGMQEEFNLQLEVDHVEQKGDLVGNWIISWKNTGAKCGKVNYARKFLTQLPYESLCCCMIAKNEAENILRCLRSVRAVCDKIVVADTGSTDGTQQIAAMMGAEVREIGWDEDFAAARNESIREVGTDWILWIDADEILLNPKHMKKYTRTKMFNAFVIRQNHLTLDMPDAKPDVPARLFRNGMGYLFTGCVHEHIEDVARGPFDHPIRPAVILPDVDIAHFGYVTEGVRRAKCSARNLKLLLKDRQLHPERELTLVLMQRDYINMTNWELQQNGFRPSEEMALRLSTVLKIHREKFVDEKHVYYPLSVSLYQQALSMMGRLGIAIDGTGLPPFQVALGLGGSVGPFESKFNEPEKRWFADRQEWVDFMAKKTNELAEGLGYGVKQVGAVEDGRGVTA